MSTEAGVKAIEKLGFTRVEAEVYVHLVQHSPATGYAIAKAIGRTQGATYKTLASLQARGAVVVDDAEGRQCRAIAPEELLDRLERDFGRQRQEASASLRDLIPSESDERVYRLTTAAQVFERARIMLAECRSIAVLDLFPGPLAQLREDIRKAAARGVRVLLMAYEPTQIPGVRTTVAVGSEQTEQMLPISWMSVFTDGRESLLAALDRSEERLHQGVWTASLLLSWGQASYAKWTLLANDLVNLMEAGAGSAEMREEYRHWTEAFPAFISNGFRDMQQRFAGSAGNST